ARSPPMPASDFSSVSMRAVVAGSVTGLAVFDSSPATRLPRSSTVAALTCGAAGGACTAGQPSSQPTRITRLAATAPEKGAITQGEMEEAALAGSAFGPVSRAGSALGSGLAAAGLLSADFSSAGLASAGLEPAGLESAGLDSADTVSETLVASRSIVGGSRLTLPGPASSSTSSAIPAVPWLLGLKHYTGIGALSYANQGRKARSKAPKRALSSGLAATSTRNAPASRKIAATLAEMQHCGTASAVISTPSARAASRKARALRWE